ncbi:DinB family protein [Pedobacter sp. Du54]|uniref:DinB family protein n=1 Tax=Pedobacter anseongensis TaxID=3133439 RepID=UPI0030A75B52
MKTHVMRVRIFVMVGCLIILPNLVFSQSRDSLQVQLIEKWANAKTYALKMAELMPENKYSFKPVPEEMSFREQLLHIAQNIEWLSTSYLGASPEITKKDTVTKTKKEVIALLSAAYNKGLSAQLSLASADLNTKVKFFAGPKSKRQILVLLHDHQAHHVGQIIVYLRLNGIKPPDYVGW